jgi:hypothetical protein
MLLLHKVFLSAKVGTVVLECRLPATPIHKCLLTYEYIAARLLISIRDLKVSNLGQDITNND